MDLNGAIAAAQKAADKLAEGPPKDAATKASAVFGKPADRATNGVSVAYGTGNEVAAEDLGNRDSPDGILFTCSFNQERLPGDSLARAVIHMGEHISELRNPAKDNEGAPPYILESDAWVVTAVSAVVGGDKFLSLPGGYVMWDINWPVADRNDKMADALKVFLSDEAVLSQ
jgi:hypothetical protein